MPRLLPALKDDDLRLLANIELFHACTRDELRQIRSLTTQAHVEQGRVLCKQGAVGSDAFIIVRGYADVCINAVWVNEIGPGEFCGEMALLDGGPRVADVIANTPMDVLALNRTEFRSLLVQVPRVALEMLEGVGRRLRALETTGPII